MIRILLLIALSFPLFSTVQQTDLQDRALQFLDLLNTGRYEEAAQQFDETMLGVMPPERLKLVWEQTVSSYGPLQSTGEVQVQEMEQYTAVNIRSTFERAEVNARVVFDAQGRISGLFFYPVTVTSTASPALIAAFAVAGVFVILLPVVLAVIARRRLGAAWKLFFFGVGIFLLFQLLTRIPLISIFSSVFGSQIAASRVLTIAWIFILSLTAGLFEETGRYVGYRWLFKPHERNWNGGVMYGLGHGGIEAIVLVGISQLSTLALLIFAPNITGMVSQELSAPLMQQVAAVTGMSPVVPFLAAFERIASIALHVALSVMVLQVFRRGSIRWLWLAITLHTLANFLIVGTPTIFALPSTTGQVFSTTLLAVVGLLSGWIIIRLREPVSQPAAQTGESI